MSILIARFVSTNSLIHWVLRTNPQLGQFSLQEFVVVFDRSPAHNGDATRAVRQLKPLAALDTFYKTDCLFPPSCHEKLLYALSA